MQRTAAASIAIAIIAGIYLLTIVEGEMFRDYHGLDVAQRKDILQAIGAQASGSVDVPRYLRTIIVPAAKTVVDNYALTNPWNVTQEQIKDAYYDELTNRMNHNYSLILDYDKNTSDPANKMYVSQQNVSLTRFNSSTDRFDLLQNRTTMFYPQRIKDVRGYMFTGQYEIGMPWGNESVRQYNYSIGIPNNIDELVVAAREVWNRSVEDYYNMSEILNRTNGGWKIAADYLNEIYDSTEDYSPGNGLESGPYPSGDVGYDDATGWDHNSIVFYGWKKASELYPQNQMPADIQNDSVEISNRIIAHTSNYANLTFSPPEWGGPSYGNFTNIYGEKKEIIEWGLTGTSVARVVGGYDEALNGLNNQT
ncbi:MAG: hypothetical protein OI715_00875 (plasmid) [Candidatus Methanoperedens sp.]|nr:MAG: hypothetical protein OI715_00875 [Candidatus Methanoperedens sp.]